MNMTEEQKEKLIEHMLEAEDIKTIYDVYIIKSIPFETWVRTTVEDLIKRQGCIACTTTDAMEYVECLEDGVGWHVDGYKCSSCGRVLRGTLHIN